MTSSAILPNSDAAATTLLDRGSFRGALGLAMLSLAGFGFFYSLVGVGIGQALFSDAANGSIVERQGTVIGSLLVAQPFVGDRYFQPRPSAAGFNPLSLAGSNQARTNTDLRRRMEETRTTIAQREAVNLSMVPSDLVTQSGGGIDPHITPQGAAIQIERVARTRGMARDTIAALVHMHTEGRQGGVLGEPRVNVLALNLALDGLPLVDMASMQTR